MRALSDAPVIVSGVEVERDGDGVSYLSIGYPGATDCRRWSGSTAPISPTDIRRLAPDVIVLAFGTNEGFNDDLDIAAYTAQYEQIVRRLQALRPGMKIVMIGPADAARPGRRCTIARASARIAAAALVQTAAVESSGKCRFPIPPKLNPVREAQRKLAARMGLAFWDWSTVQGGPLRRAGLGGRQSAADGARLRAYDP